MKLRLIESGFETYDGQMGVVFFENGLSVSDVRPNDAIRMSAVMQCEWEDGSSASVSQGILDHANIAAPVMGENYNNEQAAIIQKVREAITAVLQSNGFPELSKSQLTTRTYTREELEAISDKEGIRGLRAIAEPLGVKSNSIKELISALVER